MGSTLGIDVFAIASQLPLAITLTLIIGALIRATSPRQQPRVFGTAAATFLGTVALWSYLAVLNMALAAVLLLLGLGAAIAAAITAPRRLLLIEPLAFPICLLTLVAGAAWF